MSRAWVYSFQSAVDQAVLNNRRHALTVCVAFVAYETLQFTMYSLS